MHSNRTINVMCAIIFIALSIYSNNMAERFMSAFCFAMCVW